ncbi:lytic transglycosylase domain-containing protein [Sphingomonas carotinifaciens]|uniref:Transglycosylase SLT domain-containing protein n=2 Tax=Sphingomonas carotinifaciens TaxID=1166323 RepID=A0A1G7RCR8_9SPHN|nr:lytic transglycosylase domain-containing protein [Sphingomonas carotinifaciens]MWC45524.1 transglycosylase SLT domain-containing protein [Sphingomonas carotinifaciens]SDG08568.1 type IV secretion system protein VirB1 [Sphingomonas carotinifaciens]
MTIPPAVIVGLAAQCSPGVAPATIAAIVQTESQGNELAINVNGLGRKVALPTSVAQAVAVARAYVAQGYSVDLGLGQINSRNMKKLGLTWDNVFDPCTNLAAAGAVLAGNYHRVSAGLHPQRALRIALSMYNTGSQSRGFANGYVRKVVGNAGYSDGIQPVAVKLGALATDASEPGSAASQLADLVAENTSAEGQARAAPTPPPPSWDVFATAAYARARAEGEDR